MISVTLIKRGGYGMVILFGVLCLILLCTSIIILASFAISLYEKKNHKVKKNEPYSYLFDIF